MSQSNNALNIIIGEKLSSVTFVMNYLQLDFDGNRLTLNIWPEVIVGTIKTNYHSTDYRNIICSLINKVVSKSIFKENEYISIEFRDFGQLTVSLDPNNPEVTSPEIASFADTKGGTSVF